MFKRRLIPLAPSNESLCNNCNGACCHGGTIIELSDSGKTFLEKGGAKLVDSGLPTKAQVEARQREVLGDLAATVHAFITDAPEHPRYLLLEDCPYLERKVGGMAVCSVYEDPNKPSICSAFPAGSERFIEIRDIRYSNPEENL